MPSCLAVNYIYVFIYEKKKQTTTKNNNHTHTQKEAAAAAVFRISAATMTNHLIGRGWKCLNALSLPLNQ